MGKSSQPGVSDQLYDQLTPPFIKLSIGIPFELAQQSPALPPFLSRLPLEDDDEEEEDEEDEEEEEEEEEEEDDDEEDDDEEDDELESDSLLLLLDDLEPLLLELLLFLSL